MRALAALFSAFAALLVTVAAGAHGLGTAFVEVEEIAPGVAAAHLRVTQPAPGLRVATDDGCAVEDAGDRAALDRAMTIRCADGRLDGHAITAAGLDAGVESGVVWVRRRDGTTASRVVTRAEPTFVVPRASGALAVALDYARLGVGHIASGYDHLLFLALLVLTVRRPRAVLLAETAFTASHSLAFAATALGLVRVPTAAAEIAIAWSLVLLALDVDPRAPPARSRPAAALAFLFGLVHGLGFAGGLREIGLPDHDVAAALVAFGAGVEVGQVAFLAVLLVAFAALARLKSWPRLVLGAAYASGSLATCWCLGRLATALHL